MNNNIINPPKDAPVHFNTKLAAVCVKSEVVENSAMRDGRRDLTSNSY